MPTQKVIERFSRQVLETSLDDTAIKERPTPSRQSAAVPSQVGLALLRGPQGRVYAVASQLSDRSQTEAEMDYQTANRSKILFALALACLRLALHPSVARAKAFFRTRVPTRRVARHRPPEST
jgi:hypothetical protein